MNVGLGFAARGYRVMQNVGREALFKCSYPLNAANQDFGISLCSSGLFLNKLVHQSGNLSTAQQGNSSG